jgi:cell fate (sporulation/competence/biofilm development) regulator YmcA (YheA/YmcA/DUF963 family)
MGAFKTILMNYKGKLYAKINGKYIECTQTVQELENEIEQLKKQVSLMPRLLEFYADNFRRTDQDFDKVVKMFFEKLNKTE